MGFSGDFVLARSDHQLSELLLFGNQAWYVNGHAEPLHMCWPRPEGWQTLQVDGGLPDNDDDRWLRELVAGTGSPVMIASVMDSDLCYVRGLTPSGATWSALLDPVMAADYGVPAPVPVDDDAPSEETEQAKTVRRLLAATPGNIGQITAWAAEAGFTADRDALLTALTKRADPFVEDLFFELIDACGLPPSSPEEQHVAEPATPMHPGHRPDERCPPGAKLETAVLNLPRDSALVLECAANSDCYAQVWLRPDGTYQLEYRDLSPARHYQTRTLSAERVIAALAGWTAGEIAWQDNFQWNSISSRCTEPSKSSETDPRAQWRG